MIEDGKRILYKDGDGDIRQEPFNEVAASIIAKNLGIRRVEYDLGTINGITYSKCECMIDKNVEFVNAFIVKLEGEGKKDKYSEYIDICKDKGIADAREEIDKMIILDYVIRNTDRHVGNFGILRNSETLQWERIAPIFDNGNSFWHKAQGIEFINGKSKSDSRSFLSTNEDNIKLTGNVEWFDKKKIYETDDEVRWIFSKNINLKEKWIDKIMQEYHYRIEQLDHLLATRHM